MNKCADLSRGISKGCSKPKTPSPNAGSDGTKVYNTDVVRAFPHEDGRTTVFKSRCVVLSSVRFTRVQNHGLVAVSYFCAFQTSAFHLVSAPSISLCTFFS